MLVLPQQHYHHNTALGATGKCQSMCGSDQGEEKEEESLAEPAPFRSSK